MSSVGPIGGGSYFPPEPKRVEGGGKSQVRPIPQNTLQAMVLHIQAVLEDGDKNGAVQGINDLIDLLGPYQVTPQNAVLSELLAAKSAIQGGATLPVINTHLNAAYNLLSGQA